MIPEGAAEVVLSGELDIAEDVPESRPIGAAPEPEAAPA